MDPVHPLDVILDAWNMTNNEGIVGSSTICVATLNKKLSQLSYSNIGDCGLLVVSVTTVTTHSATNCPVVVFISLNLLPINIVIFLVVSLYFYNNDN